MENKFFNSGKQNKPQFKYSRIVKNGSISKKIVE